MQAQRGRKSLRKLQRQVKSFGDVITCGHVDMTTLHNDGLAGDTDALVLLDVATRFLGVVSVDNKSAEATEFAIRYFLADQPARRAYSDNAGNIKKAMADLKIVHEFSLPGIPKSNGLVERYVQEVLQGTRVYLVQAGCPSCFWPYAAECFVFCYNVFGPECTIMDGEDDETNDDDVGNAVFSWGKDEGDSTLPHDLAPKGEATSTLPNEILVPVVEPGGEHDLVMGKDEAEIVVTDFDPNITPAQGQV